MCEVVRVGVRGGEQLAWAAFRGRGGGSGSSGVCAAGVGGPLGGVGVPRGGAPLGGCVWVVKCGAWSGVSGGWVCGVRVLVFGREAEASVAGPGVARDGGRSWVSG